MLVNVTKDLSYQRNANDAVGEGYMTNWSDMYLRIIIRDSSLITGYTCLSILHLFNRI